MPEKRIQSHLIFYQFSKVPLVFIDYLINDKSYMFDFGTKRFLLKNCIEWYIYFFQKNNTGFSKFWGSLCFAQRSLVKALVFVKPNIT